jgi:hypothetical protein
MVPGILILCLSWGGGVLHSSALNPMDAAFSNTWISMTLDIEELIVISNKLSTRVSNASAVAEVN